jgi:hypothetical protein
MGFRFHVNYMVRTFIIAFFDADYKHISFTFISLLKFMRFSRKSQQIFVNFCVEKCCFPVLVCGVWVVWGDTKERPLSQAYGLPAPLLGEPILRWNAPIDFSVPGMLQWV